jgi:hypothetical protein
MKTAWGYHSENNLANENIGRAGEEDIVKELKVSRMRWFGNMITMDKTGLYDLKKGAKLCLLC